MEKFRNKLRKKCGKMRIWLKLEPRDLVNGVGSSEASSSWLRLGFELKRRTVQGPMLWLKKKYFHRKFQRKNWRFLTQDKPNYAKFCHNIGFWEKRQSFRRKLSKIAENWDHNIDPCSMIVHSVRNGLHYPPNTTQETAQRPFTK
jgi:hypothetical protein